MNTIEHTVGVLWLLNVLVSIAIRHYRKVRHQQHIDLGSMSWCLVGWLVLLAIIEIGGVYDPVTVTTLVVLLALGMMTHHVYYHPSTPYFVVTGFNLTLVRRMVYLTGSITIAIAGIVSATI